MSKIKKVFVIMVWYNGKTWIKKCLDSLKASNYPLSVYIIDNGSNDGSQDVIKNEYPQFVFSIRKKLRIRIGKQRRSKVCFR